MTILSIQTHVAQNVSKVWIGRKIPMAEEILQQNGCGPAWEFGKLGNLGSEKFQKMKVLKIKIRSAQNAGKVQISRKKQLPAPFGAISGKFFQGPEKCKNCRKNAYFPWWANGPYSPGLGKWLQYFFCHTYVQESGLIVLTCPVIY